MAMMRLRREDPRVVGTFKLHRRLGAGGMGVVYLGSDRRGQRVALKVIRPDLAEDQEFRSRFAREVSAARRIRGGCTARLVAADLDADRPWFATQYVPGPSLHDKVNEHGPLPPSQVASVGASLAEGLVAVHEAGVVHRDLKPSNILLSPKGPRIIDFGIAWATGASTLTHVGTAVGSPGFLAPEQVRGALVTPATDVFALGATLAYAATADSPFGQGSSEVMLYRVVHEEPQLEHVHAALAPLIHACLVKAPEERPSPLQLSLRLKEIAAREARGFPEGAGGPHGPSSAGEGAGGAQGVARATASGGHGPNRPGPASSSSRAPGPRGSSGGVRGRAPAERTRGRRTEEYQSRQRTERRGPERGRERGDRGHTSVSGTRHGAGSGHGPDAGAPRGSASRTGERAAAGRNAPRTAGRGGPGRPGPHGSRTRGPATGPRRTPAPDRRLLRQRLVVFVTVTVLVALGIATAQGCQGPDGGAGSAPQRSVPLAPLPERPHADGAARQP
ncbi:Serine/threonine protein kinase [Streptomyces sp. WMMB 714]|uniref:serine/threonine-protein kinase n=1 Tax=Streptomyces sp. WMMB 714 TaxID=1286822 RepID=UPI0005F82C5B|nr:serine/threonine-protein kinase [Streptomyces sp. WMMB 714]SCK42233.1 Serine/threonine protein kinase [Streptomyces sp. WMMB 714]